MLVVLLPTVALKAQNDPTSRSWNQPVHPFRIIGNIYYVGASEVTSFLITSLQGHILLDSGFAETVPQIEQNVATLGFRLRDIKLLLNSHAHFDHAGGLARLKQLTGAQFVASAADAELLARGGKDDFQFGDRLSYKPIKADRVIADGEQVSLGGVTLTAHLTPGHTKGCTTWTTVVQQSDRPYNVVFLGGVTIPGYHLINNQKYPDIAADYRHAFDVLKALPCDVFLGAHGSYFDFARKLSNFGQSPNPFIDPDGYRKYITDSQRAFEEQLRKETIAAAPANEADARATPEPTK